MNPGRGHGQRTLTSEPVSIAKNHDQAPYFGAFHSLNATSYRKRSARIVPFPPCCTTSTYISEVIPQLHPDFWDFLKGRQLGAKTLKLIQLYLQEW